jgi:hypothetical protein
VRSRLVNVARAHRGQRRWRVGEAATPAGEVATGPSGDRCRGWRTDGGGQPPVRSRLAKVAHAHGGQRRRRVGEATTPADEVVTGPSGDGSRLVLAVMGRGWY